DVLFERMAAEPKLLRQYWRYKMTSADPKLKAGCNEKCLLNTICNLVRTVYDDKTRCRELKAKVKESLANEPTEPPTTEKPTEKPDNGGDGAASLTASITSIVAVLYMIRQLI
ncbi:hypothetical protein DOY81_014055, partial [Sarcophaga bullata]